MSLCSVCRKSVEISLALKQTFEAVIMRELYPHSKIDIYVQVLQSDGGEWQIIPSLSFVQNSALNVRSTKTHNEV